MKDSPVRLAAGISLAALAGITGIVSYLHALAICRRAHNGVPVAYLIPFVPDLMIVTSSLALFDAARRHRPRPPLAVAALVVGVGSTIAMNVGSGLPYGLVASLIAALPAVAFVLTFETLLALLRGARAAQPETSGDQCAHTVASSADEAVVAAYLHGRDCLDEAPSQRQLSAAFGIPRPKVAQLVSSLNGQHPPESGEPPGE